MVTPRGNHKIKDGELLSLGNSAAADVDLPEIPRGQIASQFVASGPLLFEIKGDTLRVYFLEAEIGPLNTRVRAQWSGSFDEAFDEGLNPEELCALCASDAFQEIVSELRAHMLHDRSSFLGASDSRTMAQSLRWALQRWCQKRSPPGNILEEEFRAELRALNWALWSLIFSYGLLTPYLRDSRVSEVLVNGPHQIWIEIGGRLEKTDSRFGSQNELLALIERLVHGCGRRIDEALPYADARLPGGERVHAILPPLALDGACLTIRKFPKKRPSLEELVEIGSLDVHLARRIALAVEKKRNLVIAGGTGTGKTTLLNALSAHIPLHERVVTIEDAAEISLPLPHVVRLERRGANADGRGEVTLRELLRNALRMRPDRIIVGECRGAEALDMLQAMNSGHEGSMTTVHANSPADALKRLETLCLFSEVNLPQRAVREQLASSVHILIQISRLPCGKRVVQEAHELRGLDDAGHWLLSPLGDLS